MASTPEPILPPSSQELRPVLLLCSRLGRKASIHGLQGCCSKARSACRGGAQPCLSPEILTWGSFSLCMPHARLSQD